MTLCRCHQLAVVSLNIHVVSSIRLSFSFWWIIISKKCAHFGNGTIFWSIRHFDLLKIEFLFFSRFCRLQTLQGKQVRKSRHIFWFWWVGNVDDEGNAFWRCQINSKFVSGIRYEFITNWLERRTRIRRKIVLCGTLLFVLGLVLFFTGCKCVCVMITIETLKMWRWTKMKWTHFGLWKKICTHACVYHSYLSNSQHFWPETTRWGERCQHFSCDTQWTLSKLQIWIRFNAYITNALPKPTTKND